ncbi:MAG: hypothetical protein J2P36_05650, partial [Ktedonobacteraceae bacterium]|nr:hypothetical protein [Ktedonobacteraceae bacterium]
ASHVIDLSPLPEPLRHVRIGLWSGCVTFFTSFSKKTNRHPNSSPNRAQSASKAVVTLLMLCDTSCDASGSASQAAVTLCDAFLHGIFTLASSCSPEVA